MIYFYHTKRITVSIRLLNSNSYKLIKNDFVISEDNMPNGRFVYYCFIWAMFSGDTVDKTGIQH